MHWEQQEIVRRVEGLFALADQLELRLAKAPESRNLEFQELINALIDLPKLIEEFEKLSGDWSDGERDRSQFVRFKSPR